MILENIEKKKLIHSHVLMPGDEIKIVIVVDGKVMHVVTREAKKQQVITDAITFDVANHLGRKGVGAYFLYAAEK